MHHEGRISEHLLALSRGPNTCVTCFKGYIINGFRFHSKDRDNKRKTQNSGVVVVAKTSSFASARDMNPITGDVPYYGVLTEVVELHYLGGNRVVLFKCDWWDVINVGRGIKRDEYGYISVNFTRMLYTDEPFVLASQAKQVFYVKDSNEFDWYTVIQTQPRDLYQMSREISNDSEPFQQIESYDDHLPLSDLVDEDMIVWNRNDVLGDIILKNNVIPQNEKEEEERIDD